MISSPRIHTQVTDNVPVVIQQSNDEGIMYPSQFDTAAMRKVMEDFIAKLTARSNEDKAQELFIDQRPLTNVKVS